jgi:hypothetical protein
LLFLSYIFLILLHILWIQKCDLRISFYTINILYILMEMTVIPEVEETLESCKKKKKQKQKKEEDEEEKDKP